MPPVSDISWSFCPKHRCVTSCDDIMWCHIMSRHHNETSHVVTSLAMSLRWDRTSLYSAELLCNEISPGDPELWPTSLTFNRSLAKVKVDSNTKNQGHRSNGLRVLTHTQTQTYRNTDSSCINREIKMKGAGSKGWNCERSKEHGPPTPQQRLISQLGHSVWIAWILLHAMEWTSGNEVRDEHGKSNESDILTPAGLLYLQRWLFYQKRWWAWSLANRSLVFIALLSSQPLIQDPA